MHLLDNLISCSISVRYNKWNKSKHPEFHVQMFSARCDLTLRATSGSLWNRCSWSFHFRNCTNELSRVDPKYPKYPKYRGHDRGFHYSFVPDWLLMLLSCRKCVKSCLIKYRATYRLVSSLWSIINWAGTLYFSIRLRSYQRQDTVHDWTQIVCKTL